MNDTRPPKPKRRWYQFRLRTLLLVTLVLALFFAWMGSGLQRARRNREALAEVYEVVGKEDGAIHAERVTPPGLLGILLGDPGVRRVVYVRAPNEFDDRAMEIIGGLPSLRNLYLSNTQVTGPGLESLKGLANLRELYLGSSQFTDATGVTDARLAHLKGLANIRELCLSGSAVTDAGLEYLKGLTGLEALNLDGTRVTDAGLEHLEGLSNLQWLYLKGTKVTNEGLEKL